MFLQYQRTDKWKAAGMTHAIGQKTNFVANAAVYNQSQG